MTEWRSWNRVDDGEYFSSENSAHNQAVAIDRDHTVLLVENGLVGSHDNLDAWKRRR